MANSARSLSGPRSGQRVRLKIGRNPFSTKKIVKLANKALKMPSRRFSARGTIRDAARVLYDRAHSARPCVRHFGLNRSFPTQSRRRVERRIRGAGCGEGVDAYHSYCTALRLNFAKKRELRGEVIAHRSPCAARNSPYGAAADAKARKAARASFR